MAGTLTPHTFTLTPLDSTIQLSNNIVFTGASSKLSFTKSSSETTIVLENKVNGEAFNRFVLRTSGNMIWGPGTGTQDLQLVRTGTKLLEINDAGGVSLDFDMSGAAGPKLVFNTDTNLYRSAADRLKTDDLFDATTLGVASKVKAGTPVDGDWAVAPPIGTMVVDTTGNKVWFRTASATWKGAAIA